jgi:hypothetical protein
MKSLRATFTALALAAAAVGGVAHAQGPAPAVDPRALERLHGKIVKLEPPTLTLKADDGRIGDVDFGRYADMLRYGLRKNQGVTVTGFYAGDRRHMVARYAKSDESDPNVGGLVEVPDPRSNPVASPRRPAESPSASPATPR